MALKEEVGSLLARYDKKEFVVSGPELLAMRAGEEMTQEMQDSLLAKYLLHYLGVFNQQWQQRQEQRKTKA